MSKPPVPPSETWEWNPDAPFWPWIIKFFTIELLYDYDNLGITDPTPRLCRQVGRELLHQLKYHPELFNK